MVLGAVLFVLGFTAVFVAFGTAFGGLGRLLLQHADLLNRIFGVITILVGLAFLGWLPFLQRTARITARPAAGLAGAPLLGIVFGLGWTPCLGPTLSAVYSLAFTEATATRGAILGLAYCLGLGIPFVLVALGARWAVGRHDLPAPARPHGDPGGRRRPRAGRADAGHGCVDRAHGLAALLAGGDRLRGDVAVTVAAPPKPAAAPPPARPSAGTSRRREAAAVVAAADRDAHRDRAALPAGPGRRARFAAAPALAVAEQREPVLRRPPDAGADPRPALPVRRLQLPVVRRGLPAAVRLADRLRAAAHPGARPRSAGGTAAGAPAPAAAARLR